LFETAAPSPFNANWQYPNYNEKYRRLAALLGNNDACIVSRFYT